MGPAERLASGDGMVAANVVPTGKNVKHPETRSAYREIYTLQPETCGQVIGCFDFAQRWFTE
jgi:hypothetical protein